MNKELFSNTFVASTRTIYTPSDFAKYNLFHLQEAGELQALKPHISSRSKLGSYLFFVVTSGTGSLTYENTEYLLQPGDCVFIDCQKPYSHHPAPNNLWTLQWIHFFSSNMAGIYNKYLERGGVPVITPSTTEAYSTLLTEIHQLADSDDHIKDMRINEKIASLLTLIMSESWHPENNSHTILKKQSLQQIKTYLEEHYKEHLTLDLLAEKFYINKYYLTRIFKEQFGSTILAYLNHVRITHAKQLLRFSNLTVEEIGHEVGIDEPTYFNRVFKKVEGTTPGEYRKRW